MPDDNSNTDQNGATEGETPAGQDDSGTEDVSGLKSALQKERQARREAEKSLKEREDAEKSELQRAQEAAKEAEQRAEDAEAQALRLKVAARKGLSEKQASRLVGDTEEDLEADADELIAEFTRDDESEDDSDEQPLSRRPKEKLESGADPDAEEQPDPDEIADKILSRNTI